MAQIAASPPRTRGRTVRLIGAALRSPRGLLGAILALAVFAIAFLGPLVSPSPYDFAGAPFSPPGNGNGLLGTDVLGRDVLARVLCGGWRILLLAVAATILAILLGTMLGVISAYRRGLVDGVTMRSVDIMLALPQLVFVLLMLSVVGPKPGLVVLAAGISQAPQVARVLYSAAQEVCERDYVKAVAVWGVVPRTVIRRHVVPSLITPLMVECGIRLSGSIVLIAGLGFLGLGTQPPTPDWGTMINENRLGLPTNPWAVVAPAALLAVLAVGTNLLSDAIARVNIGDRSVADPILLSRTGEQQ